MKVKKNIKNKSKNPTDIALMVESVAQEEIFEFDKSRIVNKLIEEIECPIEIAEKVAGIVEDKLRQTNIKILTPSLIRSFINVVLCENGFNKELESNSEIVISTHDIEALIFGENKENGNTPHNPESINLSIAGNVIKQLTLKKILTKDLRSFHLNGDGHIHDMDMHFRLYCSGHNPEYIKRNGIKNMDNIPNDSDPAKSAWVAARHIASATLFYTSLFAGAIGWDSVNTFLASYTKGWTYKKYKQLAQTLIFDFAQLAGAKGGQVSFTDFNIHANIPEYYKDTYAVGKNGCYMIANQYGEINYIYDREKAETFAKENNFRILTYKDFEYEARQLCKALLDVSKEGDARGMPFGFPKLHLHINDDVFNIKEAKEIFDYACEVLSVQGNPYIDFDRNAAAMSQCCFDKNQEVKFKLLNWFQDGNVEKIGALFEGLKDKDSILYVYSLGKYEPAKIVKIPRYNKDMYEITIIKKDSNGLLSEIRIILTSDHINLTPLGEKRTSELTYDDFLAYYDENDKSDYSYRKIEKIEKIENYNEEFVYCFEMLNKNDPYFTLANGIHTHNCRLVIEFDNEDLELTKTPEELRFVGGQNVSINLANLPLKCNNIEDSIYEEIKNRMNLAVKAHIIKKEYIQKIVDAKNSPLKFYKEGSDGKPYVNFEKISWLIGIVGLNEYVYNLTGLQLHESKSAFIKGVELITFMNDYCKELTKKHKMSFKIEETPAESTAGRFAKLDKKTYGDKAYMQSNEHGFYYSNSIHFNVDAKIDYIDELNYQSKFHTLVEAGSMIHLWVGDKKPSPEAIADLIYKVWKHTKCAEMTISPNKTVCNNCKTTIDGFFELCPKCNSDNIFWIARITGYQVRVDKFNNSKLAELFNRRTDDINNGSADHNELFYLDTNLNNETSNIVKVYSLPNCPNCRQIKKFCKENEIEFIDINAKDDFKVRALLNVEGLEYFPIVNINNNLIECDNVDLLKQSLLEFKAKNN